MTDKIKLPPMVGTLAELPEHIRECINEFAKAAVRLNAQADAKPMFWVRLCSDGGYEGPIHDSRIEDVRKQSGVWRPLYLAAPQPAPTPRKIEIPPPGADALDVAFAEGWNQCCDAYFGGLPPQAPLVVTVFKTNSDAAEAAPQPAQQDAKPIYQYQLATGGWIDQTRDSYEYNKANGVKGLRIVYEAAPAAPAAQPRGLTLAAVGHKHFGNPIPPAWYAAAKELLSAAAQQPLTVPDGFVPQTCPHCNETWLMEAQQPLTDEQFQKIRRSLSQQSGWDGDGWDQALKEAIEQAHGIGVKP